MEILELYQEWCKLTKRSGGVLVGSSIREFFTWLEDEGWYLSNEAQDRPFSDPYKQNTHSWSYRKAIDSIEENLKR